MQREYIFLHLQLTPFLHQNKPPRESIICGRVGSWSITMALIVLKFLLKTRQNACAIYTRMGNGTKSTYAYDRQRERLQGMLLTANGDSIMQTQYKYDPVDNILGISNVITPKAPKAPKAPKKPKGSEGRAVWMASPSTPRPYSASRASVSPSTISSATGAWPPKSVRAYSKTPTGMAQTSSRPGRKTTRCV